MLSLSAGLTYSSLPEAQDLTVTGPEQFLDGSGDGTRGGLCSLSLPKPCAGCVHSLLGLWPDWNSRPTLLSASILNTELAAAVQLWVSSAFSPTLGGSGKSKFQREQNRNAPSPKYTLGDSLYLNA